MNSGPIAFSVLVTAALFATASLKLIYAPYGSWKQLIQRLIEKRSRPQLYLLIIACSLSTLMSAYALILVISLLLGQQVAGLAIMVFAVACLALVSQTASNGGGY